MLSYPSTISELPPYHLVDYANIALDDLDHLGAHILVYIVGNWNPVLAVTAELHGCVYCLQQALLVNAGNDEVTFVNGLRTLRTCADADGREGMADTREETRFFRKRSRITYHCKGIHLKAVVVMEAERFVPDNAAVEFEAAFLQAVA